MQNRKDEMDCCHKIKIVGFGMEYRNDYSLKRGIHLKEVLVRESQNDKRPITKRIVLDGINIIFFKGMLKEDHIYDIRRNSPYLQMHFELNGSMAYVPYTPKDAEHAIYANQHALFYLPELNGRVIYSAGEDIFRVEIETSTAWLMKAFHEDLSLLGDFRDKITSRHPAILGGKNFPITTQMREIIMAIYHCNLTQPLVKTMFIEGKLFELLSLQLSQLLDVNHQLTRPVLKKDDFDRICYIRNLLKANINCSHSINNLADTACMNRTKLQKAFKSVFGCTIYDFLTKERMEKAHELLISAEYVKIAEIARQVGYKNPNHFSTAFKNWFGISPKDIRNQG